MIDYRETLFLNDWVDKNTQKVDLIASWERLVSVYNQLCFVDSLTDQQRMSEFNSVIKEINKFLSRMRTSLGAVEDIDGAVSVLEDAYMLGKNIVVDSRQSVAYQKLKQQWISRSVAELLDAKSNIENEPEDDNE